MSFEIFTVSVALTAYVAIVTALLNRLRRRKIESRYESERKQKEFVETIKISLSNDAISELDDVHNLYLGHFDEDKINQWTHDEISLFLRKVIVEISKTAKISKNTRDTQINLLKSLIAESEDKSDKAAQTIPFSRAPNPERGLLTDMLELTEKENEFVRTKLKELSHAITVRQETMSQLSEEKGKSLKWAKWGVFGTVFFSAVSIALTVFK